MVKKAEIYFKIFFLHLVILRNTFLYIQIVDVFDRVTLMYYTVSTSPGVVYESHEYTYDMNSNITYERYFADYGTGQITDRTRKHTYDELNRLVSTEETDNLTGNGTQSSYRYDRAGNRIEAITTGGPTLEIKVSNSKVYKIRY